MSTHKIVLVGESGVGKSTILHQYVHHEFKSTFTSTIGIDFAYKHEWVGKNGNRSKREDADKIQFRIFDTGGQKKFESITDHYHKMASDAVIIVYDITDAYSFDRACQYIQRTKEIIAKMEDVPIILVANKSDLDFQRVISEEEGQEMAYAEDCIYLETSAKDHDSIVTIFKVIAAKLHGIDLSLDESPYLSDDSDSEDYMVSPMSIHLKILNKIMKCCFCMKAYKEV